MSDDQILLFGKSCDRSLVSLACAHAENNIRAWPHKRCQTWDYLQKRPYVCQCPCHNPENRSQLIVELACALKLP